MNEWKRLKRDNLPSDILTANYEFEFKSFCIEDDWSSVAYIVERRHILLERLNKNNWQYRYKKIQPKTHTHEEILSNWWHIFDEQLQEYNWIKINDYKKGEYFICWDFEGEGSIWVSKSYFNTIMYSEFPPEEDEE